MKRVEGESGRVEDESSSNCAQGRARGGISSIHASAAHSPGHCMTSHHSDSATLELTSYQLLPRFLSWPPFPLSARGTITKRSCSARALEAMSKAARTLQDEHPAVYPFSRENWGERAEYAMK